jgi:hypothetical protein
MEVSDIEIPALGRREFFGLFAWRVLQAAGGAVLLAELGGRRALAVPGCGLHNACTPLVHHQNICDQPAPAANICNAGTGPNACVAEASGEANICDAPGRNTCSSGGEQPMNTCQGGFGSGQNHCDGAAQTNSCTGSPGANTCHAAPGAGPTNWCTSGADSNYCTEGANVCDPYPGGGSAHSSLQTGSG